MGADQSSARICIYRVVQECLINSYKYAISEQPRVIAFEDANVVTIIVKDGGADATKGVGHKLSTGLGLSGLRRRLEALGGTLSTQFQQGSTEVTAKLVINKG